MLCHCAEPRQKTLDLESACQMLELVLGPRAHVPSFLQFLQVLFLSPLLCIVALGVDASHDLL